MSTMALYFGEPYGNMVFSLMTLVISMVWVGGRASGPAGRRVGGFVLITNPHSQTQPPISALTLTLAFTLTLAVHFPHPSEPLDLGQVRRRRRHYWSLPNLVS